MFVFQVLATLRYMISAAHCTNRQLRCSTFARLARFLKYFQYISLILFAKFAFAQEESKEIVNGAERIFNIASGIDGSSSYLAADAICRVFNNKHDESLRCNVVQGKNSLYNLQALVKGNADLAVVPSPLIKDAYNGTNAFINYGRNDQLRVLFPLYVQSLTILVKKDSNIKSLSDLDGKNVSFIDYLPINKDTYTAFFKLSGIKEENIQKRFYEGKDNNLALCSGAVDAVMSVSTHPRPEISKILEGCECRFLEITPDIVSKAIEDPIYTRYIIPRGTYPGIDLVHTFGTQVYLVTTTYFNNTILDILIKKTAGSVPKIKSLYPELANFQLGNLNEQVSGSAPMHPELANFLRERESTSPSGT